MSYLRGVEIDPCPQTAFRLSAVKRRYTLCINGTGGGYEYDAYSKGDGFQVGLVGAVNF